MDVPIKNVYTVVWAWEIIPEDCRGKWQQELFKCADRHSAPTSDITNQCLQVFPLNNAALIVKAAPETKIPLLPPQRCRSSGDCRWWRCPSRGRGRRWFVLHRVNVGLCLRLTQSPTLPRNEPPLCACSLCFVARSEIGLSSSRIWTFC